MASPSASLLTALDAVHDELRGAVLFVDDVAAAALALGVGLPHLLDMGVLNVLPLSVVQPPEQSPALPGQDKYSERDGVFQRKAVVLCSGLVYEAYEAIRRSLCQVRKCQVIAVATAPVSASDDDALWAPWRDVCQLHI
eukprot:6180608-Pleurochrysis_carterae.AAC.1